MSNLDKRIRKVTYETLQEVINNLYEVVEDKEFSVHFPEFSHIVGKLYEKAEEKCKNKENIYGLFTLFNYFDDITYSISELAINGNDEYIRECITNLGLEVVTFSKIIDNRDSLWEHITLNDIMYIKSTHLKRIYEDYGVPFNTILD